MLYAGGMRAVSACCVALAMMFSLPSAAAQSVRLMPVDEAERIGLARYRVAPGEALSIGRSVDGTSGLSRAGRPA